MDNRSPSPTPAKISRVPSAKRWGSSSKPPSLKQPSKPSLEPQDQLEVLKPKGRPLSSNVYLKKTIAQGWKAQELPDTELSQGELEKLVGDEVESLGEKKKALQGMLTSQGLATVEQTTQNDWTRGEVKIPDFHCARCRDHFYGLTDELCDEETERVRREEEVLKKGRSDTSTNTRAHRGLSAKSPRSQHKKLETETNSISANSNQNQKSNFETQRSDNNREEISFDSSDDEPKKGVKHTNNLFSEKEHSLVNSTSSKEIEKENKQNKQNNKTNKQDDNISKSEFQCDHKESAFDNLSRDGTGIKIDTSHSRFNPGSQGVELGSGGDGNGTRGGTSEIGGVVSGKERRRGVKKVAGGISSGEDTESDSADGVAERNELGKKRFGKKSRDKKGESAGSGREGTASGGEDTLTRVSTQIGTDTNTSIGLGGMGKERIMNETRTNEGELEHAWKRENKSNTDSNNAYDRNTAGLQSESITVGEQLFRSGYRRQRKEDFDWSDPLCDSPDTGAHSIGQDGRAATAGRKTHVDQSESAAQLLNSLLSAKRPSSAYPAGSSYSFTLTQPYTFSYYKS